MFCDLSVFILQASCKQTVNTISSCDKEVVAQAKVIEKEVGSPQILSERLGMMKFYMQYLQNWLTKLLTHSWWCSVPISSHYSCRIIVPGPF